MKERLRLLLIDVAQLLDGWHQDGTAWTEWDESVRQRVSEMLRELVPVQPPAPPPQKEKQDFSWFKGGVDHGLLKELVESQEEPLQHGHAFVPWMVRVNGKGDPVPVMEHGVPVCECGQPESAHKGKGE